MDEIHRILMDYQAERMLMAIDPDNPICPGCKRRFFVEEIAHQVQGKLVCAECADDELERLTGSRY